MFNFNLLFFILCLLYKLGWCKTDKFDYVVVGAGPTGTMTAIGLAEQGYSTLLIDAGQDYMAPNISTPGLHVNSNEDPNITWDFYVKYYEEPTGLRQKVLYPRASGLGGCTLQNAMFHVFPNKQDFKKMVKITGDKSWSESNMRKYYDKIVRPTLIERTPLIRGLNKFGPTLQRMASGITNILTDKNKGWLKLSTVNLGNLLSVDSKLLDIATNLFPRPLFSDLLGFDINAESDPSYLDQEQSFLIPVNINPEVGSKRYGIYEHLKFKRKQLKSKLTVWTNTFATKIILDETNTARGIEFLQGKYLKKVGKRVNIRNGTPGKVFAKKEIIISIGTFSTPQLMMLSGIGDSEHLQEMGITPRVHLPGVGLNLHDRYEVSVNYKFEDDFKLTKPCLFREDKSDPCYKQFVESASGPYTSNGALFGTTMKSSRKLVSPDIFLITSAGYFTGYHHGNAKELFENKDQLTIVVLKAHTHAHRGRIKLRTTDPTDQPDINFKYFSEGVDKDLEPIVKGIRAARKMFHKLSSPHKEVFPGKKIKTNKQLEQYIINTAWGHHATGTMKIGRSDDPLTVLDSKFRVKGVKNLRVADLSIFQEIPGYFPVLYLYMVGAKAAEVIGKA